eukprot:TRINITY_DN3092_c0_g1_i1.p1 TRINITY_DN3092_c0_g1~~TRINITY_DN3092_c0_g1_i1.p1  ORF type:complete len:648 (+),score=213.62 TRINITY_DN3092_c0_g1_i1:30-1973(+)
MHRRSRTEESLVHEEFESDNDNDNDDNDNDNDDNDDNDNHNDNDNDNDKGKGKDNDRGNDTDSENENKDKDKDNHKESDNDNDNNDNDTNSISILSQNPSSFRIELTSPEFVAVSLSFPPKNIAGNGNDSNIQDDEIDALDANDALDCDIQKIHTLNVSQQDNNNDQHPIQSNCVENSEETTVFDSNVECSMESRGTPESSVSVDLSFKVPSCTEKKEKKNKKKKEIGKEKMNERNEKRLSKDPAFPPLPPPPEKWRYFFENSKKFQSLSEIGEVVHSNSEPPPPSGSPSSAYNDDSGSFLSFEVPRKRKSKEKEKETSKESEESQHPIKQSHPSLATVFHNKTLRSFFYDFMRKEFATENMHFIESADCFAEITDHSLLKEKAISIYNKFICPGSEEEINISGSTKERLKSVVFSGNVEPYIFEDVICEVRSLINENFYKRWIATNEWKSVEWSAYHPKTPSFIEVFSDQRLRNLFMLHTRKQNDSSLFDLWLDIGNATKLSALEAKKMLEKHKSVIPDKLYTEVMISFPSETGALLEKLRHEIERNIEKTQFSRWALLRTWVWAMHKTSQFSSSSLSPSFSSSLTPSATPVSASITSATFASASASASGTLSSLSAPSKSIQSNPTASSAKSFKLQILPSLKSKI